VTATAAITSSLDPPKTTADYEAADDCPATARARERLAALIAAARCFMPARSASGGTDPNPRRRAFTPFGRVR